MCIDVKIYLLYEQSVFVKVMQMTHFSTLLIFSLCYITTYKQLMESGVVMMMMMKMMMKMISPLCSLVPTAPDRFPISLIPFPSRARTVLHPTARSHL